MNEEFIFRVGADVSGFTKSISQVEAELKKVQTELKTKTGAAIVETNKYIVELQGSLTNLRSVGLSKLPQAANQGASSLNALGQVARDAPFGFIAISNNLPILFDQLGTLSSKSGGAIGALKALGSSLIGPAGITFAVGAAISAVTVLVQKYGSLGAAATALFSNDPISDIIVRNTKSIKDFNEALRTNGEIVAEATGSTQGLALKARSLADVIFNLAESEKSRKNALEGLKQLDSERFANFDIEKGKIDGLKQAVDSYTNAIIAKAIAEKFSQKVSEQAVRFEQERNILAERYKQLDLLKKQYPQVGKEVESYYKKIETNSDILAGEFDYLSPAATQFIELNKQIKDQEGVLKGVANEWENLANVTKGYIQLENSLAIFGNKKAIKDAETAAQKRLRQQEEERKEALRTTQERIRRQDFLNKEDNKNLDRSIKERRKLEREAGLNIPTKLPTTTTIPVNTNRLKENAQIATDALKNIKQEANLDAAFNLAQDTFFNPISDVFENFLNTGKFAFKEFGKAVLQAINQIVAKIIATGIISLLFTIFSGGFGAAAGGAKGGFKTVLSAITSSLGFGINKGGGGGQPNLANLSGGGMQLAGQVVFTQRGSDLVGVLNRTNATINRVG